MILFFDTETTGLPKNWKAPVTDLDNWPRLVQLAYLVYDFDGNLIHSGNEIIKPNGFTIPTEASKVHGITTDIANQRGSKIEEVFELFSIHLKRAKVIVAHNMAYDEKIIGSELIRLGLENTLDSKEKICTMESTVDLCKIDGPYGYKWPKLEELHRFLFNNDFEGAHDAMADIQATAKCFWELVKNRGGNYFKNRIIAENIDFIGLTQNEINEYHSFFDQDKFLAKLIISLYYPFTKYELEKHWEDIIKGEAFYTCEFYDIDTVYQPKLGLCFNENIEWYDDLKKNWSIGLVNMFNGTIDGTGLNFTIDIDTKYDLSRIIPLDLTHEINSRNHHILDFWIRNYFDPEDLENEPPIIIVEELMNKNFQILTISKLISLYEEHNWILILNKSIWKNTLSKFFTKDRISYYLSFEKDFTP
ncbi:MAG: 3'-5' exonuclease [Bacteroidetes bacterium]|nr:3'-5' exonuclease [Bacteroidota bacterium]